MKTSLNITNPNSLKTYLDGGYLFATYSDIRVRIAGVHDNKIKIFADPGKGKDLINKYVGLGELTDIELVDGKQQQIKSQGTQSKNGESTLVQF